MDAALYDFTGELTVDGGEGSNAARSGSEGSALPGVQEPPAGVESAFGKKEIKKAKRRLERIVFAKVGQLMRQDPEFPDPEDHDNWNTLNTARLANKYFYQVVAELGIEFKDGPKLTTTRDSAQKFLRGELNGITRQNFTQAARFQPRTLNITVATVPLFGETITWDGAGDGLNWSDPLN